MSSSCTPWRSFVIHFITVIQYVVSLFELLLRIVNVCRKIKKNNLPILEIIFLYFEETRSKGIQKNVWQNFFFFVIHRLKVKK